MAFVENLAVYVSIILTGLCLVSWTVLLTAEKNWIKKISYVYSMDAGLFQVDFGGGLASMVLGGKAEELAPEVVQFFKDLWFHKYSLQEFKERMCVLPTGTGIEGISNQCTLWESVQYASWGMIFMSFLGCLFLLFGAGFLYYWAFVRAREKTRKIWKSLFALGPVCLFFGLAQYILVVTNVNSMPPKTVSGDVLGHNVPIAGFLCFLACLPFAVTTFGIKRSLEEIRNENTSAQKHFAREYGAEYGALAPAQHTHGKPPHQQSSSGSGYGSQPWGGHTMETNRGGWGATGGYAVTMASTSTAVRPPMNTTFQSVGQTSTYSSPPQGLIGTTGMPQIGSVSQTTVHTVAYGSSAPSMASSSLQASQLPLHLQQAKATSSQNEGYLRGQDMAMPSPPKEEDASPAKSPTTSPTTAGDVGFYTVGGGSGVISSQNQGYLRGNVDMAMPSPSSGDPSEDRRRSFSAGMPGLP